MTQWTPFQVLPDAPVHLAAGDTVGWAVPFSAPFITGCWRSSGFNLGVWAPDPPVDCYVLWQGALHCLLSHESLHED